MKQKLPPYNTQPPHNMIVVVKVGLDLFNIQYIKYSGYDRIQHIKYDLSAEDVAQFLGNN